MDRYIRPLHGYRKTINYLRTSLPQFSFINRAALESCLNSSISSRMVYRSLIKTLSPNGKSDKMWRVHSREILPRLALCLFFKLVELIVERLTSAYMSNSGIESTKLVMKESRRTTDIIVVSSSFFTVTFGNSRYASLDGLLRNSVSVELESLVNGNVSWEPLYLISSKEASLQNCVFLMQSGSDLKSFEYASDIWSCRKASF